MYQAKTAGRHSALRKRKGVLLVAVILFSAFLLVFHFWHAIAAQEVAAFMMPPECFVDQRRGLQTSSLEAEQQSGHSSLRTSKLVILTEDDKHAKILSRWESCREEVFLAIKAFTEALCCIYDRHHSGANPQPSLWVQPDHFFCLQNCWSVYEKYAMGADELGPLSLSGKTTFGGLSATLVDSLDTLWLVGLHEEFQRARDWVAANVTLEGKTRVSLFETTIRIVGGLVSAYDLSHDDLFLHKARGLSDKLMRAFNHTQSGIPLNWIYLNWTLQDYSDNAFQSRSFALAEFGSIQLEFAALSHRTHNPKYAQTTEPLLKQLASNFPATALFPVWYGPDLRGFGGSVFTVGAMTDSFYEYLLKLWLLHDKQEEMYRAMWEVSMDAVIHELIGVSADGQSYVGQRSLGSDLSATMEHLACYLPGNLALGVMHKAVPPPKADRYLQAAADLTFTCWQMYNQTATGLARDITTYNVTSAGFPAVAQNMASNLLRPETVESLFYLWRATKDERYREYGWLIFQAFQKHAKTPQGAYAAISNVELLPAVQTDSMESFWISETLKYLWLLFSNDSALSLSEFVLNTEAHPLRISSQST